MDRENIIVHLIYPVTKKLDPRLGTIITREQLDLDFLEHNPNLTIPQEREMIAIPFKDKKKFLICVVANVSWSYYFNDDVGYNGVTYTGSVIEEVFIRVVPKINADGHVVTSDPKEIFEGTDIYSLDGYEKFVKRLVQQLKNLDPQELKNMDLSTLNNLNPDYKADNPTASNTNNDPVDDNPSLPPPLSFNIGFDVDDLIDG